MTRRPVRTASGSKLGLGRPTAPASPPGARVHVSRRCAAAGAGGVCGGSSVTVHTQALTVKSATQRCNSSRVLAMSSVLRRSASPGWKKGALSSTPLREQNVTAVERPPPQQAGRCCVGDAATAGRGRRDIRVASGAGNVLGIAETASPVASGTSDVLGIADVASPVSSGFTSLTTDAVGVADAVTPVASGVSAAGAGAAAENAPELTQLAVFSGCSQAEEESPPEHTPVPVQQQLRDWADQQEEAIVTKLDEDKEEVKDSLGSAASVEDVRSESETPWLPPLPRGSAKVAAAVAAATDITGPMAEAAARLAAAAASLSAACTENPGLHAVTLQHQAALKESPQLWPLMQTTKSSVANSCISSGSSSSNDSSSNVKGLSVEVQNRDEAAAQAAIEDLLIGLRREQRLRESLVLGSQRQLVGNVLPEGELLSPMSVVSTVSLPKDSCKSEHRHVGHATEEEEGLKEILGSTTPVEEDPHVDSATPWLPPPPRGSAKVAAAVAAATDFTGPMAEAAARLAAAAASLSAASLSAACTENPDILSAVTSQAALREPSQIWHLMPATKSSIANSSSSAVDDSQGGVSKGSDSSSNNVKGLSVEAAIEDLWSGLRREQRLRETSALGSQQQLMGNVLLEGDLLSPMSVVSAASGSKAVPPGTCHGFQQPLPEGRWPQHGEVPEDSPEEVASLKARPTPIAVTSPPLSERSSRSRARGPHSIGGGGSVRDLSADSLMHSVDDEGSDGEELRNAVEKWNEQRDDEGEDETTASLLSSITSPRALHGRLSQAELALKEAKLEVEGLRTQLAECEGRLRLQSDGPTQALPDNCHASFEARQLRTALAERDQQLLQQASAFSAVQRENERLRAQGTSRK